MRRFIKKIILFFTIFFVLNISVFELGIHYFKTDLLSEKCLDHEFKSIANDYQWITKISSNQKIILAGSSSVKYGLSCSQLNILSGNKFAFLSFAMDARDPVETYFLLKNTNLKGVKEIYFGLDPWIYSKRYYRYRNSYLYLDFSFTEAISYNFEHDKLTLIKRYKSFLSYLFSNKEKELFEQIDMPIPDDFGSVALHQNPINFDEPIENGFQIDRYGWSSLQFQYLIKIANLCKSEKIEFNTFIPPKRSDYNNKYKSKCKLIHNEFVENLVDVNFNSVIMGSFNQLKDNKSFFVEAYHLSWAGQKEYSSIFYQLIHEKKVFFTKDYQWFNAKYKTKGKSSKNSTE